MPDPTSPIPFDLAGLEDIVRNASPELAKQVDADTDSAPEPIQQPGEVIPDSAPITEPVVEAAPEPEPEPEPEADKSGAEETSISDELEELNRQSAAVKTKPAAVPETKPEEIAKPAPTSPRDSDLGLDTRQASAMHPKTKKIIEERNQKIIAERNKAESLAKEKEALATQLNEAREALK